LSLEEAFHSLQQNVNADPAQVDEARRRREMFQMAFSNDSDADRSVPSGSLARGSQIEPINDVDLLWVYRHEKHPDWGQGGSSAEDALNHAKDRIKELLGSEEALVELFGEEGRQMRWVREAHLKNHAVKCFLDDPKDENAFTVDVVPALPRDPRGFWIPETSSAGWIETDPVYLIERVLKRHSGYGEGQFVQLIRVLKRWSQDKGRVIKGLTIEVLALDYLHDIERPLALARFFEAALNHIHDPILDPAGLGGEVQSDLDRDRAEALLQRAADLSARAVVAAQRRKEEDAQCLWHEVFGEIFPKPAGGCGKKANGAVGAGVAAGALGSRRRVQRVEEG
jgi:hypothetical protein